MRVFTGYPCCARNCFSGQLRGRRAGVLEMIDGSACSRVPLPATSRCQNRGGRPLCCSHLVHFALTYISCSCDCTTCVVLPRAKLLVGCLSDTWREQHRNLGLDGRRRDGRAAGAFSLMWSSLSGRFISEHARLWAYARTLRQTSKTYVGSMARLQRSVGQWA